jgi:GNAT superfamily N-acetyltransferase
MKAKSAEILLRLTTEVDLFTTEDLVNRPASDGVTAYRGDILIADGVDEDTITQGILIEHLPAGEIIAFLVDLQQLMQVPKSRGEAIDDVLADYGLDDELSRLITDRVSNCHLNAGRKAPSASKILYIQHIYLNEDYRGRDIGLFALSACIERVGDKDTMVLLPLSPLQFSDVAHEVESCLLYTSHRDAAIGILKKHFEKLLFQPLPTSKSKLDIENTVILYRPVDPLTSDAL